MLFIPQGFIAPPIAELDDTDKDLDVNILAGACEAPMH